MSEHRKDKKFLRSCSQSRCKRKGLNRNNNHFIPEDEFDSDAPLQESVRRNKYERDTWGKWPKHSLVRKWLLTKVGQKFNDIHHDLKELMSERIYVEYGIKHFIEEGYVDEEGHLRCKDGRRIWHSRCMTTYIDNNGIIQRYSEPITKKRTELLAYVSINGVGYLLRNGHYFKFDLDKITRYSLNYKNANITLDQLCYGRYLSSDPSCIDVHDLRSCCSKDIEMLKGIALINHDHSQTL